VAWRRRHPRWVQILAVLLILALLPGCQERWARFCIPAAYAVTGLCIALLVSPSLGAAVAGFILGGLLGAAVYNNSLKRSLMEPGGRPSPRR